MFTLAHGICVECMPCLCACSMLLTTLFRCSDSSLLAFEFAWGIVGNLGSRQAERKCGSAVGQDGRQGLNWLNCFFHQNKPKLFSCFYLIVFVSPWFLFHATFISVRKSCVCVHLRQIKNTIYTISSPSPALSRSKWIRNKLHLDTYVHLFARRALQQGAMIVLIIQGSYN